MEKLLAIAVICLLYESIKDVFFCLRQGEFRFLTHLDLTGGEILETLFCLNKVAIVNNFDHILVLNHCIIAFFRITVTTLDLKIVIDMSVNPKLRFLALIDTVGLLILLLVGTIVELAE